VLANLLRPLLLELARALRQPPAHLIAGGLLAAEADEVAGAFTQRMGLAEQARRSDGEWAALWLAGSG
jgi:ribosomal protein L11 methylase PrmA